MIPIYSPNIQLYTNSAINAIQSGWISNHGIYVEKSTILFKEKFNVKHAILMNNGTCATHCLFIALQYKYPNIKKIYIPNNAYVAAWNACFMEYSKSQVEVMKMNIETWNINTDEDYIKSLDTNSAVLIVHNLGNVINVPRLKSIRPDLIFLEDNCEGFTGKYNNIYSGTSDSTLCSSVSFYGNKIITTGEGGAFLTNDDDVYNYIKKVYSQGMSQTRYLHDTHAYNYRMTNIQAAFLYDQLNNLNAIISNKKCVFDNYKKMFEPLIKTNKVNLFKNEDNTESACWIFGVRIVNNKLNIDELNNFFNDNNVEIRPFFYPISCHQHLSDISFDDNNSPKLNKQIIMIPSSPDITLEEQFDVVSAFYKLLLNKIEIMTIDNNCIHLLEKFINNIDDKHFRYFNSRNIDIIKNHELTILLKHNNITIGYAHIDFEDKYWIGIYLEKDYRNKGIGKLILSYLISYSKYKNLKKLHLTVDVDNNSAVKIYSKLGFREINRSDKIVYMNLDL
jgi:perosamine synthetase